MTGLQDADIKKDEKMKVGIYARGSTNEQKTNEQQIKELYDYCELYKHEVVAEYQDTESGTTTNRKGFQRMLQDVKDNRIEAVLIWKFDRLSRSLLDLINTVNIFKQYNVQLISKHELVDTSKPEGRLLFNILGSFAEFEVDSIKKRTLLGLERAKREGKLCHRPRKEIDVDFVKKKLEQNTLTEVANMLKMSRVTLKKRLTEASVELQRGAKILK